MPASANPPNTMLTVIEVAETSSSYPVVPIANGREYRLAAAGMCFKQTESVNNKSYMINGCVW